MFKIKMTVATTRKYDYEGKKYVEISGILAGHGLFKMAVNEKLIPDDLEGHEGFNPRFYGEAGRTVLILIPFFLPLTSFNPRFYGEAGRTKKYFAALKTAKKSFNPRFYGEAGRTWLMALV